VVRVYRCSEWSIQDLSDQLSQHYPGCRKLSMTLGGRPIETAQLAVDEPFGRLEQTGLFHTMQRRIKSPRTDPMSVAGQFACYPRPMDLTIGGVVEDVESDRPAPKLV
jgi:hypothetical protein